MADYWLQSAHHKRPLVFVELLEVAQVRPTIFRSNTISFGQHPFLFSKLSDLIVDRLVSEVLPNGEELQVLVASWLIKHNISEDMIDSKGAWQR